MTLIFTSCSGGSSQDAKTLSASSSQIFITKVIDGYISGANIFIDHNSFVHNCSKNVKKMMHFMEKMTHPDGNISFFNDSAFNIAAPTKKLLDYASRL